MRAAEAAGPGPLFCPLELSGLCTLEMPKNQSLQLLEAPNLFQQKARGVPQKVQLGQEVWEQCPGTAVVIRRGQD